LLRDASGRITAGILQINNTQRFLCGLKVEEEIIRYRQGDPQRNFEQYGGTKFGFDFERPFYLFEHQLNPSFRTMPWADNLMFFILGRAREILGVSLSPVLPDGMRGLIILTGDDDEAFLE